MNKLRLVCVFGIAFALSEPCVWAQSPPAKPAVAPVGAAPRPAHVPDPSVANPGKADPSDAALPPPADPLKQEAVTDPVPTLATPAVDFIMKASMDGMTLVQLGHAASSHSRNIAVQQFARALIAEQEKADAALGALAIRHGTSVPTVLDGTHQGVVDGIASKHGVDLDREYLQTIIAASDQMMPLYAAASTQTDADVAAFARQTLPSLKRRRRTAASLTGGAAATAPNPR